MMQEWTDEKSKRFTDLRLAEMREDLTKAEQVELAQLYAEQDAMDEAFYTPILTRMEKSHAKLETEIAALEAENVELVTLYNQQSALLNEAKQWLEQFERRYAILQRNYQKLAQPTL